MQILGNGDSAGSRSGLHPERLDQNLGHCEPIVAQARGRARKGRRALDSSIVMDEGGTALGEAIS
jgi:hypothetical protein